MKLLRRVQTKKQKEKKSSFIFNPLYVTLDLSLEDIQAQIAFRLLQWGETGSSNLIKVWIVHTFLKGSKIDDLDKVIEWVKSHFFLPEDWRAFRKYVKKIVDRFVSQERRIMAIEDELFRMGQNQGGLYPVSAFGRILNISAQEQEKVEGKLYRWAREGKIRAERKREGMLLDIAEVRQLWEWKKQRKKLTEILSDHLKMDQDSARKWIKRLERKGLSPNEIIAKARGRIRKDGHPPG